MPCICRLVGWLSRVWCRLAQASLGALFLMLFVAFLLLLSVCWECSPGYQVRSVVSILANVVAKVLRELVEGKGVVVNSLLVAVIVQLAPGFVSCASDSGFEL